MTNSKLWFRFLAFFLASGLAAPLAASDIPVNDQTQNFQVQAAVAVSPSGAILVSWDHEDEVPNPVDSVEARVFGADELALGPQFRVSDAQFRGELSAVAADSAGNFVVVWQKGETTIAARRYQADGTPLGAVVHVSENGWPSTGEAFPDVAAAPDGGFVVAWTNFEGRIAIQRFGANAAPIGTRVLMPEVNPTFVHDRASIALDLEGNIAVAWMAVVDFVARIYLQRLSADGDFLGAAERVDFGTRVLSPPVVVSDDQGNLAVGWIDSQQDQSNMRALVQRYSSSGSPEGGNVEILRNCSEIAGAADGQGRALFVMDTDAAPGTRRGLVGVKLAIDGGLLGEPFLVTSRLAQHLRTAVDCTRAGACVVAWEEVEANGVDPTLSDIARSEILPAGGIFGDGFESGDLFRWAQ